MQPNIKLVAFDLDGTLTQHKTPLGPENRQVLDELSRRYRLLMVGAGSALRIFRQLEGYPIDILGNYGLQTGLYNHETGELDIVSDVHVPCDRAEIGRRIEALRQRFGFTQYAGESVEYHNSGCVTFPLLGTKADLADKLAFDPDRSRRRAIYQEVVDAFPDYTAFVGGSSSFDFAPLPYNKYLALDRYCTQLGLRHEEVAYVGDDYGPGGNDSSVYNTDFHFFPIDDYRQLRNVLQPLLDETN